MAYKFHNPDFVSLDAGATGATGAAMATNQGHQLHYIIEWGTGVTAGSVVIEGAASSGYVGTWAEIDTVTFSGTAPKADTATWPDPPRFARGRVASATGGTVTVRLNVTVADG